MLGLRMLKAIMLGGVLLALTACSMGDQDLAWKKIINEKAVVFDVRTQEEYDYGHLPEARLVPYDNFEAALPNLGIQKDTPVVLYCRRGVRADAVQSMLLSKGYTNVTNGGGYENLLEARPK